MQNRIRLLKQQEEKIKKRSEIQAKKIQEVMRFRQAAQKHRERMQAAREKAEQDEEVRKREWAEHKKRLLNGRLRSQYQYRRQKDVEIKEAKLEKMERQYAIKCNKSAETARL